MSAVGFISHALLGGTAEAAKGIGNKIREEAKLKRQQALDKTRTQNTMQEQSHASALATGRENLQREHTSEEAEKSREHDLKLAELEHDRSKDLVDYELNTKLELAREKAKASGELTAQQESNLERINGDIDHLHQMERELTSGRTGEFGEIGLVTPDNSGEKLREIRQRLKAKELAFNRVLGNQRGVNASAAILNEAAKITDPAEQQEYLADLKESKLYNEDLAKDVATVWEAKAEPSPEQSGSQPARGSQQPDSQSTEGNQQSRQQSGATSQPQGGMLSEAQAASTPKPDPKPEPQGDQGAQPTPEERPGANQQSAQDPEAGKPWMEQRLGPKIESGVRALSDAAQQAAEKNIQRAAKELSQIARGERDPYQGNIRQFLTNNPEALRALSMEDLQKLQQRYGEDFINQFLQ